MELQLLGLLRLIQKSDQRDLFSLDEQTASPQKLDVQFVDRTSRTSFICHDILANFDTVVCVDGLFYCGWTKGKNPLSFENRVLLKVPLFTTYDKKKSFTGLDLDDYLPNSHIFEEYNRLFHGQESGASLIYKDGVKILRDEEAQVFVRKTNIRLGKLGCRGTFREWYLLKGYHGGYYWPEKKYGLLNLMLQTAVSQDQDPTQLIMLPTEKKIVRLGVRYTADVCMKILCVEFVKGCLTFLEFVKRVVEKLGQTGIKNEMDIQQDLTEIYEIAKLGHQYLPIPVSLQQDSIALLGSLTLDNVIKL